MKTSKILCSHFNIDISSISNNAFVNCDYCGNTIYKLTDNKIYSTIKPIGYQGRNEFDLINVFSNLKPSFEKNEEPPSQWYMKNRIKAIKLLQKYSQIYKYSDLTYYLAMMYMDIIMRNLSKLPQKKFEVYIINCILIASKFKESNIIEPNVSRFTSTGNYYDIDEMDIIIGEIEVLKLLKYKLNYFSSYEILNIFFYNGIVYSGEIINKSREFINIVYCFAKKILYDIVHNEHILKFNNLQIAFSVVHLTRKNFGFKNNFFNLIKKFYNIHLNDYKSCLSIAKKIINNESLENNEKAENEETESMKLKLVSQSSRNVSSILKASQTKENFPKQNLNKNLKVNFVTKNLKVSDGKTKLNELKTPTKGDIEKGSPIPESIQKNNNKEGNISSSDCGKEIEEIRSKSENRKKIIEKIYSKYQLDRSFLYIKSVKTKGINECNDKYKLENFRFININNNFSFIKRKRSRSLIILPHFIFL